MTNDDRRARHDLAHDVSHRNGDVRGLARLKLCRKRSMMRMTPLQSGQAGTSAQGRLPFLFERREQTLFISYAAPA